MGLQEMAPPPPAENNNSTSTSGGDHALKSWLSRDPFGPPGIRGAWTNKIGLRRGVQLLRRMGVEDVEGPLPPAGGSEWESRMQNSDAAAVGALLEIVLGSSPASSHLGIHFAVVPAALKHGVSAGALKELVRRHSAGMHSGPRGLIGVLDRHDNSVESLDLAHLRIWV